MPGDRQFTSHVHVSGSERREDNLFRELLNICVGLEDRLLSGSDEEVEFVADMVS
jgi:hypothetical protein